MREGLDRAGKLPVGQTSFDLQAYMRHAAGITRAGLYGEVSRRFTPHVAGFASASAGLMHAYGVTSVEATAMAGLRGWF